MPQLTPPVRHQLRLGRQVGDLRRHGLQSGTQQARQAGQQGKQIEGRHRTPLGHDPIDADQQRTVAQAQPDLIEVNISCPNVHSEFGEPFAANPESTAAVTAQVKQALVGTGIPVIVKLAPNVPSVARIARAAVEAGADALCAGGDGCGLFLRADRG